MIVSAVAIILLIIVFYIALAPKITDLGLFPRYQSLLQRKLVLKKPAIIYDMGNEPYRFRPLSLHEDRLLPFPKKYMLPAGTAIRLTDLKNYYNSVSGSSTIYALGESETPDGSVSAFEYTYGRFGGRINTKELPELSAAPWE